MKNLGDRKAHSQKLPFMLIGLSLIIHMAILLPKIELKKESDINTHGPQVVDFSNINLKREEKKIELKDLKTFANKNQKKKEKLRDKINPMSKLTRPLDKVSAKDQQVNNFLKEENLLSVSSQKINNSDANFQIELPPGLKLDQLNEAQMVLYNFQMRTAKQYFNSFYANLGEHQQQKPHLTFPMTDKKQRMTGKITYDESGNIIKIQMVQVTSQTNLQDFFENLLKRMHTVSNPPKMILSNGEFSVYFSLNIY